MRKFWNWTKNDSGVRTLHLEGVIASDSWWGDEITPAMFKEELTAGSGDIIVWINSPGGDVFAGASIYNMLKDYDGKVTIHVDGLAASAASVVAMAGDEILISPVGMMMIHNPSTIAWGDSAEMLRAKALLDEVKESILNAYEKQTLLSREEVSQLMNDETWMSAKKAVELGFADKILFSESDEAAQPSVVDFVFSRMAVTNSLLNKFAQSKPTAVAEEPPTEPQAQPTTCCACEEMKRMLAESAAPLLLAQYAADAAEQPIGTPVEMLEKRLDLIKNISKI